MTDEHDPSITGCYGDPLVQTPNIDNLAEDGVLFENYYCNSPLCVPSRLSFTSGKYVNRVDAWNNQSTLPADIESLPRLLNRSGYETVLCGKMHYAPDKRFGFQKDLLPHHNRNHKHVHTRRRTAGDETADIWNWISRSGKFHEGYDSKVLKKDLECTEAAKKYLNGRTGDESDKPFFFLLGYLAPHFPLIVPPGIVNKYEGKVPAPELPRGLLENLPKNYKHLRRGFGNIYAKDDITMTGRELYWALVEWMDTQLGIILDCLEENGLAKNTIVIFTSDHGENKGDHGLWWKNCCYDHAAKVPMIIRWPGTLAKGERREKVASHVDLVKTLLEIAGSEIPDDWNGDSFLGYAKDSNQDWKDMAICEYHGHNIVSGITSIRKGKYKLVYHNSKPDQGFESEYELFDLEEDPKELENLAYKSEYENLRDRLMSEMIDELGAHPQESEYKFEDYVGKIRYWWKTRTGELARKLAEPRLKKKYADRLDLESN